MGGFCLVAQPLAIALSAQFWVLHDGVSVLDADGIVEPPHGPGAAPEVSELPVTVQVDRVPDDVVADIGLVDVGADDKGIVSFGKPIYTTDMDRAEQKLLPGKAYEQVKNLSNQL